jgi:hypothetical protein
MKVCIILLAVFLSGCSKESKKPAADNSSSTGKDSTADLSNQAADTSSELLHENGERSNVGYVRYSVSKIPSSVIYKGSVLAMAQWDDKLGSNIVFITETAENSNEDSRSKELFAYHVVKRDSDYKQLWKINDFIKDCPVDLTLEYISKSLSITDLDSNGIAESSFLYKMSCKGDVSSDNMKLIMHEKEKKYALRGTMELLMRRGVYERGTMNVDKSFDNAPSVFLEFAKDQWNKYKTQSIGE